MKYLVLIPDGMADRKIAQLGDKTPMEAADKPTIDMLASQSVVGTVLNVPNGMVPESDTANMAIMSFDPKVYSKGRAPLEAVSMGLHMDDDDVAVRFNTVALSEGERYEDRIMLDHSADEIPTEESSQLVKALDEKFGNEARRFYTGVSYRHCVLWKGVDEKYEFARPHDIIGKRIGDYLPEGEFLDFMRESCRVLEAHPVNVDRKRRGLKPANSAWLWSPGKRPTLPSFKEKFGLTATVVSAVDLIKGIGICAGMEVPDVEGATGNIHTNFEGKAEAAINAFKSGSDLVYLHVEAPDECGHRAEAENKVLSIEYIDKRILAPILEYFKAEAEDGYGIMILPDHPTPVALRTHTAEPVPFMIYSSRSEAPGVSCFTERTAAEKQDFMPDGSKLMRRFIDICSS